MEGRVKSESTVRRRLSILYTVRKISRKQRKRNEKGIKNKYHLEIRQKIRRKNEQRPRKEKTRK